MSVPIWSTTAGDLGTVPELNYFALGLTAYDSENPNNPVSFELVAGTTPPGIHVDGYGLIAGSPEITTKNLKESISKFAVRARVSDYYEEIINDGATFTLTNPVTLEINRAEAIINGVEILAATFVRSATNMVTVTLPRPLVAGEIAAVSLYRFPAPAPDYVEQFTGNGATSVYVLAETIGFTATRVTTIVNDNIIAESTYNKTLSGVFTVTLAEPLADGKVMTASLYATARDPATVISTTAPFTITLNSTAGFTNNQPIVFSSVATENYTMYGGLSDQIRYYVKQVINPTHMTISTTSSGPVYTGIKTSTKTMKVAATTSVITPVVTQNFSLADTKTKYVLSEYISFDIIRTLVVVNNTEIRSCSFKKARTGVVTVTLDKPIALGESVVVSLYQIGSGISDRTFVITVVGENPPKVLKYDPLGSYFDGQYLNIDITALDLDPDDTLSWEITAGRLPDGLTLDRNTGKISGYIVPFYVSDTQTSVITNIGYDDAAFGSYTFDDTTPTVTYLPILSPSTDVYVNYQFTITVSDGKFTDAKSYNLEVISNSDVVVSSTQIKVDSNRFTADQKKKYSPMMLNTPGEIGPFQHDNEFLYKFDAVDYNGDQIEYYIDNESEVGFGSGYNSTTQFDTTPYDPAGIGLPSYLTLDTDTGWLYGTVPQLSELETVFKFNVRARKKTVFDKALDGTDRYYNSKRQQFQLTILGRLDNTVTWNTPADLGSINNGEVSELKITATSNTESPMYYELLEGSNSRLPQGLQLSDDGLIMGKTSFSTFECDNGTTTFDKHDFNVAETTIDQTYQLTVRVYDVNTTAPTPATPAITNIATNGFVTVTSGTYVSGQSFNITDMRVTTFTNVSVGTAGRITFDALATAPASGTAVYVSGTNTGSATGITTNTTYYIASSPAPTTTQATLISSNPGTTPVGVLTTSAGTTTGLAFKTNGALIGFAPGVYYVVPGANDSSTGDFYFTRSITGTSIKLARTYADATAQTPIPITVTKACAISNSTVLLTPSITYITTTGEATVTYGTYYRGQRLHVTARTLGTAVGFSVGEYYIIDDAVGCKVRLANSHINAKRRISITSVTASGTITASTMTVSEVYQTVDATRRFTLKVNKAHIKPCDNLYMQSRLQKDSRDELNSLLLQNTDVIPTSDLYRANDSFFGVAKHLRLLIANGVNPVSAADYVSIMYRAHYTKPLYFGDVKTARVLNPDNSIRYEVIYLEVLDNLRGQDGTNISTDVNVLRNRIKLTVDTHYVKADTSITDDGISKLAPNNLFNMRRIIIRGLGQVNKALPEWMVDKQADGTVLGFTTGCVLAYVNPGKSEKIAFRIKEKIANAGYNFTNLNVVIDRYVWDNNLSANYNRIADKFLSDKVTTFDGFTQSYTPDFDSAGNLIYPAAMSPVSFVTPVLAPESEPNNLIYEYPYNQYVNNPKSFPSTAKTTFDGGSMEFFTYRDKYEAQDQGDAYLKFPRLNIYHTQNTK